MNTMKNLLFLILVSFVVSCSSDDSTPVTPVNTFDGPVAGTWKTIESSIGEYQNVNTSSCNDSEPTGGLYWTYVLSEDGSFLVKYSCEDGELMHGTYTFSNGVLTASGDDFGSITYNVTDLGNNKLQIDVVEPSNSAYSSIVEKQ